jgi:hypothetical protein
MVAPEYRDGETSKDSAISTRISRERHARLQRRHLIDPNED